VGDLRCAADRVYDDDAMGAAGLVHSARAWLSAALLVAPGPDGSRVFTTKRRLHVERNWVVVASVLTSVALGWRP